MARHPRIIKLMTAEQRLKDEMLQAVKLARQNVAQKIQQGSIKAIRANSRESVYREVSGVYQNLSDSLDIVIKRLGAKDAKDWHSLAIEDIRKAEALTGKSILKFDLDRIENYFRAISPATAEDFAATFTKKMATEDIRALRSAFIEATRAQQIEGLTAQQTQKRLQSSWNEAAGNLNDSRFIDAAGRPWTNARYLDMLSRTTAQRIAHQSYMDTLISNGDDLVQIQNVDNEACEICQAWDSVIVSSSGSSKDYPSYQDAVDAGWNHNNCRCNIFRVDPDLNQAELDAQAAANTPGDLSDVDAVAAYSEQFEAV